MSAPDYKPVAWFKHGPYEGDEPLQCVFEDPQDNDCFSPLFGGPLAESAPDLLAFAQWFLANRNGPGLSMAALAVAKALGES